MNIDCENLLLDNIFENSGLNRMLEQVKPFKPGFTDEQLSKIPDWKIKSMSYGIHYFNFSITDRNLEIKKFLVSKLEALSPKIIKKQSPSELFECPNCGIEVPKIYVMCSSFGEVCSDCYDKSSN